MSLTVSETDPESLIFPQVDKTNGERKDSGSVSETVRLV